MATAPLTKVVWISGLSVLGILVGVFALLHKSSAHKSHAESADSDVQTRGNSDLPQWSRQKRDSTLSTPRWQLPSVPPSATQQPPILGPRVLTPQEERIRAGARIISTSGSASIELTRRGAALRAEMSSSLPENLTGRIDFGDINCFRAGCVMRVSYKDIDASATLRAHVLRVPSFTDWPGTKMYIPVNPNDLASAQDWCFWSSVEEAKASLTIE